MDNKKLANLKTIKKKQPRRHAGQSGRSQHRGDEQATQVQVDGKMRQQASRQGPTTTFFGLSPSGLGVRTWVDALRRMVERSLIGLA